MSSEIWLTKNSINKMLDTLESDELTGAVGAWQKFSQQNRQTMNLSYKDFDEIQPAVDKFESETKSRLNIFLEGECLMIRRNALDRIKFKNGNFANEIFQHGIYDAIDLSFKIWLAGFKLQLAPTFVHWQKSNSITVEQLSKEEQLFKDKWGFSIQYSTNVRLDILNMIQEPVSDSPDFLEIGCASGGTLIEIKNRYHKAKLHGIEINSKSAKISSCFAEIENVDIEKFAPEHWHENFDYIICGDVIEHLVDPWAAVKNIRAMLKPDGHLLASIPNVCHIEVVRDYLHGHWRYQDAGILDRTHLRFFTLESIQTMFQSENMAGVMLPKQLVSSETDYRFAQELSARFNIPLNNFTTYQWLVNVRKI